MAAIKKQKTKNKKIKRGLVGNRDLGGRGQTNKNKRGQKKKSKKKKKQRVAGI